MRDSYISKEKRFVCGPGDLFAIIRPTYSRTNDSADLAVCTFVVYFMHWDENEVPQERLVCIQRIVIDIF